MHIERAARHGLVVLALVQKGASCAGYGGGVVVVGGILPISDGGNSPYCSFTKEREKKRHLLRVVNEQ